MSERPYMNRNATTWLLSVGLVFSVYFMVIGAYSYSSYADFFVVLSPVLAATLVIRALRHHRHASRS